MNQPSATLTACVDLPDVIPSPRSAAHSEVVERDDQARGKASIMLLKTIAEVLDVRLVLPRLSAIANSLVSHDCLALAFVDGANALTLEARSTETFPRFQKLTMTGNDGLHIVGDLRRAHLRLAECDPPDLVERLVAKGYRSLLVTRSVAGRQAIALLFLSKHPNAFTPDDETTARQIAEYVAMAVSHEQLAEADCQRLEAQVRSKRLDTRAQSLAQGVARQSRHQTGVGQSVEWRSVIKTAMQVAETDTTVLLHGESGTGKEVVARFIHRASARRVGPFVAINCAALPEHLFESELFGHERGAFTGAQEAKHGQFEMASGGVLFLDEVTEMVPAAQAKLLRVLQEREFLRLGGTRLLKANVRVIAASNRDLRDAVARGAFREDLYYRLQVFDIRIPPLRDRASDIPLFVEAFLQEIGQSMGRRGIGVTPEAIDKLIMHTWPGNVRELRNVLERAAILCEGGTIEPRHLSLNATHVSPTRPTSDLRASERRAIEDVLRATAGNKAKAARRLGLTRTQLYGRLRKYDLDAQGTRRR